MAAVVTDQIQQMFDELSNNRLFARFVSICSPNDFSGQNDQVVNKVVLILECMAKRIVDTPHHDRYIPLKLETKLLLDSFALGQLLNDPALIIEQDNKGYNVYPQICNSNKGHSVFRCAGSCGVHHSHKVLNENGKIMHCERCHASCEDAPHMIDCLDCDDD